jgi:hypothetical protein
MVDSKRKGSSNEKEIARLLTNWITGKPKPEIFWKIGSSGSKFTQDIKHNVVGSMSGDIVAIDEKGAILTNKFSIECKHYKTCDFLPLLRGNGDVLKWWQQCYNDAVEANKHPMLIFKRNNFERIIGLPFNYESFFQHEPKIMFKNDLYNVVFVLFNNFLKYNYKQFMNFGKNIC